jgi:hypothetical protein
MDPKNRTGIWWAVGGVALIAFLIWLIAACSALGGSPRTSAAHAAVEQKLQEIQADGVVTPEESQAYIDAVKAAWKVEQEETKFGWEDILKGFATGSVPAGIAALLLNVFRNRKEKRDWGTPDAPKA